VDDNLILPGYTQRMKAIRSTTQAIDLLGGNHAVAALIPRASHKAVSNWRRKKFPANTFVILRDELRDRGFDPPISLWAMKIRNRKRTNHNDRVDRAAQGEISPTGG
jgi:hypothetical protein